MRDLHAGTPLFCSSYHFLHSGKMQVNLIIARPFDLMKYFHLHVRRTRRETTFIFYYTDLRWLKYHTRLETAVGSTKSHCNCRQETICCYLENAVDSVPDIWVQIRLCGKTNQLLGVLITPKRHDSEKNSWRILYRAEWIRSPKDVRTVQLASKTPQTYGAFSGKAIA